MVDVTTDLLKARLRQLRLPTMGQEFEKLARDAAASNQTFVEFLLRLTEAELATRAADAVAVRIKNSRFPVLKDFDTYDFSVMPPLSKPKVLDLAPKRVGGSPSTPESAERARVSVPLPHLSLFELRPTPGRLRG
jgi:DNA replication protein DnaC